MAGDLASVPLLLGLGLHEFSMSAGSILQTRELIGGLSLEEWGRHAKQALTFGGQQEVLSYVQEKLKGDSNR